ncbi:hypothetical protein SKAU_G00027710 [Synaphobranchus kaupii]|uniref:BHLH domain-containing protein n=1 Tax=Synaphobranchus kaupii TaxID=118154 RepID=A0A9Q1GEA5_SYNKA|nr:hypothetical protein SKAU_G00027710 [Synaphobranchus kaupii]
MTADHGFPERLPYARSMALGFSVDHQGATFKDAFGLPLHFDTTYLDPAYGHRYTSRFSYIPFSGHMGMYDYSFEPAFIRKRNERERQRVRCVNEGYARLREHLPQEFEDKRLSKVETLRAAVNYIKHMQSEVTSVRDHQGRGRYESRQKPRRAGGSTLKKTARQALRAQYWYWLREAQGCPATYSRGTTL